MQVLAPHAIFSSLCQEAPSKICNFKKNISDYPLIHRVSNRWQKCAILSAIVTTIIGIACGILLSSAPLIISFSILLGSSCIGFHYLREYERIKGLKTIVADLQSTHEELESIAEDLRNENEQLQNTNQELAETNENFRGTHAEFVQTQNQLRETQEQFEETRNQLETTQNRLQETQDELEETNRSLTGQVGSLTLQVTALTQSALKIQEQMLAFQEGNIDLRTHSELIYESTQVLRREIETSAAWQEQIQEAFALKDRETSDQLAELNTFIRKADETIHDKIQSLASLNRQLRENTRELEQTRILYAEERARFEEIRNSLALIRDEVAREFRSNIDGLKEERHAIHGENEKLQNLVERAMLLVENAPLEAQGPSRNRCVPLLGGIPVY